MKLTSSLFKDKIKLKRVVTSNVYNSNLLDKQLKKYLFMLIDNQ